MQLKKAYRYNTKKKKRKKAETLVRKKYFYQIRK